jgi:hypothetical protein
MNTTDRQRLDELANAVGQPNQPRGQLIAARSSAVRSFDPDPLGPPRDEARILQRLAVLASAAGTDWYYRFPVRGQGGQQDWIEGPSIKLADTLHRIYGNASYQIREEDVGDAWVFAVRYTDRETGSSIERSYRQRKGQRSLRTKDADRALDITYQIGQSKAIRNVIVHALGEFADYAVSCARQSMVEKIGKDLENWRRRTIEGIARIPCDLSRVERVVGRPARAWLAADISRVVASMQAIADGMATLDESFPPAEAPEPAPTPAPATTEIRANDSGDNPVPDDTAQQVDPAINRA